MNIDERIDQELTYYKSSIKQLYLRSYQFYLFLLIGFIVLTVTGIGIMSFIIRIFLVILLIYELFIGLSLITHMREYAFDEYFKKIQKEMIQNFSSEKNLNVKEDEKFYYFFYTKDLFVKLNKKNTRNLPSKIEGYTLLVGFDTKISKRVIEDPLYLFYYDITKIKQMTFKQ